MKKIGVILSGCGVFDGSEIYETVFTLLHLDKLGAQAVIMAPNIPQMHVIDHLTGSEAEGSRSVLVEAARLARGNIEDLKAVDWASLDGAIFPGGFGAAKNLCTFASNGPDATVNADVETFIRGLYGEGKPLGFMCIAPALAAKVLGDEGIELTIGNDADTAKAIETCGARHVNCAVDAIHCDHARKIVSTPAYMLGQRMSEVEAGIQKLVQTVVDWA